jgi:hypothetical protein
MNMIIKPAELKKRVLRGHSAAKYGAVELHVNEASGEMWATNKYWVTRASRLASLLGEYNLSADEAGAYEVNGKVSRTDKQAANIAIMVDTSGEDHIVPGTRVRVAGQEAYVQDGHGCLMAVYQLADSTMVGLLADEAEWLSSTADAPIPEGHRFGERRVMFRKTAHGVSAAFIVDTVHVIEPHKYGTDPDTREQIDVPEVSEPGEPILLAIVVASKYSEG